MGEMPEECNGLELIEGQTEFNKLTCRWVKRAVGRQRKEKKEKEIKPKKGGFKNPKSICLVLEKDLIDFIKSQALQKSMQEGVYIEPNELIRQALQKAFPTPKQCDMFGTKK